MSKFKIELELTGFKMKIEGSKDDIPSIQNAIGQQMGALLQPPGIGLEQPDLQTRQPVPPMVDITPPKTVDTAPRRSKRRSSTAVTARAVPSAKQLIDWPKDAHKYGVPNQSWTTGEKAMWVIYVARESGAQRELSAKAIEETFNLHYREAGVILAGNIKRDLGKAKGKRWVSEDAVQNPPAWYLNEEGIKEVQRRMAAIEQPAAAQ